jgi:hypothetical protein
MRAEHWALRFAVCAVIFFLTGAARAQGAPAAPPAGPAVGANAQASAGGLPPALSSGYVFTPYVDRDMSIGPGSLYWMLSFSGTRAEAPARSSFGVNMGVGTGIVERLWAEAYLGTLALAPEARWSEPRVGLLYQIANTYPFEIDTAAYVTFDLWRGRVVERVDPGVILVFRSGHRVRLDTGAYIPLSFDKKIALGLNIPARLIVQLAPPVHVGMTTGASFPDLAYFGRSATVPLGLLAGYSAPLGGGATVTVMPAFSWPTFFTPGSADPVHTRAFVAELSTAISVSP